MSPSSKAPSTLLDSDSCASPSPSTRLFSRDANVGLFSSSLATELTAVVLGFAKQSMPSSRKRSVNAACLPAKKPGVSASPGFVSGRLSACIPGTDLESGV